MDNVKFDTDKGLLTRAFPEMVWLLIFAKLRQCHKVLESLFNASNFLRLLFNPLRTKFLLASVLPNLETALEKSGIEVRMSTLLKMRSVCSTWCWAVSEGGSENVFATRIFVKDVMGRKKNPEPWFMSHFEDSHSGNNLRGPFIGNRAVLDLRGSNSGSPYDEPGPNGTVRRFWNTTGGRDPETPFQLCLPKYGNTLRHCELTIYCGFVLETWYPPVLVETLRHMPNLQSLTLKMSIRPPDSITDPLLANLSLLDDLPIFTSLRSLKLSIMNQGLIGKLLPKTPKLTTLSADAQ